MKNQMKLINGLIIFIMAAIMISACESKYSSDPKDTVIKLFGAMERNDKAAILPLIDLAQIMERGTSDYALQTDQPRVFHQPEELLEDLTGEGLTKTRWFSMQRVIGEVDMLGDSATVEVSFINKTTNIQYYTKFGLYKKEGYWKIYTFRKIEE
ncbi:MAG: hypothetical protein ABIJ45_05070 [Candidatus Zixiibacteriota bacterium]